VVPQWSRDPKLLLHLHVDHAVKCNRVRWLGGTRSKGSGALEKPPLGARLPGHRCAVGSRSRVPGHRAKWLSSIAVIEQGKAGRLR